MRLQSLSEPRSSFPSRGFHRPTPEHPDEAFFIFPPARPPKWMAGNSPHKVAANNLAKLATSPPPRPLHRPVPSTVPTPHTLGDRRSLIA